ncbi:hypothetical protein [Streptomyces griseorubiginosus]|uniref:Uncharacterized protein n=1 Tax=Streptomyces griseorubiginosus TaxID=67304 RepID=A0A124HW67_9ACTN|nr:hypothetical protein [Streptomyces griseorubiginosus]KUN60615.1 hypothetical protein AQJ54_35935 [Streptomyces griseorubiginosus]
MTLPPIVTTLGPQLFAWAALFLLVLFAAVLLPAVWSRKPARRRAAERIVRLLVDAATFVFRGRR